MNYQPLFDLMSEHGLTLLEGEMEEIINVLNKMQQPKQKRLTLERFKELCVKLITFEASYNALLPYLADEQPEQFTALIDTKPDPSRLEVAAMIMQELIHHRTKYDTRGSIAEDALLHADELIKQAKL